MSKPTRTGMKRLAKERNALYLAARVVLGRGLTATAETLERTAAIIDRELDQMHREVWAIEEAHRAELEKS